MKLHIQNQTGTITLTLDPAARPSIDDMNDIMRATARTDEEFDALCRESTRWPACTNDEFYDRCRAWAAAQP